MNVGYAAGLSTSVLWTVTSLFFTAASRRVGVTVVNAARIGMAVGLHALTHRVLTGRWIPEARGGQIGCLAMSGILGLAIGDQALLLAFLRIGPRLSLLTMTSAPLLATMLGWMFLGESLEARGWAGMGLSISGMAWVIAERRGEGQGPAPGHRVSGFILAFIGAACQAGGLLLSKQGMGHGWLPVDQHLSPQSATLVRMTFAALGMIPILAVHAARRRRRTATDDGAPRKEDRVAGFFLAFCGSVTGPYLGVWCSLIASNLISLGLAQTLCSFSPLFILPFAATIHRERITLRAVLGACLAVAGLAVLFSG